jgi:hypothetical protein
MKKKQILTSKLSLFLLTILGTMLLPACTGTIPAVSSSGGVRVWLDQPMDGDVITLSALSLKASARNEASGGVNRVDFLVNSILVGSVNTDPSQPLVSAEAPWNPSAPGIYTIQAQAFGSGGQATSEIAQICIFSGSASSDCGLPAQGQEQGITKQALDITVTPITVTPQGNQEFKLGASPNPVYVGECKKGEPKVVNFEGYYSGDNNAVVEADLHGFVRGASGTQQEFIVVMSPAGGGGYTASYDLTAIDASILGGVNGSLVYTMALLNDRKEFYATSPEMSLQVAPCIYGQQPPPVVTTVVPQQPPGGDTTPPSVKAQISADVIYYGGKGCNPTSVTVTAYVTDNVAVARANIFWYYAPGGDPYHAQTALMSGSGSNWSYTIIPSQTGTIAYWVEGWDTSDNHAQSQGPNTVAVVACQGQPPPVVTTEVPPPPQDTTPPTISGGSPSPDSIDISCGPTQTSAKVSASDASGVAAIYVNWQYSSGSSGKDDASSGYYTFPAPNIGDTSLTYWFEACDTLNNCAPSKSFSVKVTDCKQP